MQDTQRLSSSYQDPFEEYKRREEKKRARKTETQETRTREAEEKAKDDTNWFGVKVGAEKSQGVGGGGVGKYLHIGGASSAPKRPLPAASPVEATENGKKKRKIGFGSFEGW